MRRFFAVAIVLLSFQVLLSSPNQPPKDFAGIYEIQGSENEKKYAGICLIQKKGDGYLVQNIVGGNALGIAVIVEGKLIVAWTQGQFVGLTIYDSITLEGKWLVSSEMAWHDEELTFIQKQPKVK